MTPQPTASSATECKSQPLLFQDLGPRKVVADFSGGTLSTDGGVLFLRQVDLSLGLTRRLADCFGDQRHQIFVEHSVAELLAQRLYSEALGYEDINDHQQLRRDPLLATACGKQDPLGADRSFHPGPALAAPSTLNRLELSNNKSTRCHKLPHDPKKIEALLVAMGTRCLPKHAVEIVLDLDAMGHRLHGGQEGRHFNAYHDDYVYLPLYAFVGNLPLWAQLRTSDHDAAQGVVPALEQMVAALRRRCKKARIIIRGDSGFCREEIMAWCERQSAVYYCLGLAKNSVLLERAGQAMMDARARHCLSGAAPTRVFTEFEYQTKTETWSRARRVIAKAEVTAAGDNPRFLVTNLPAKGFKEDKDPADAGRFTAAPLYEELYCARGEMENVLKQQVLDLKADRMSTHHLASNQLRLWLATFAYLLMERVRALGLAGTELAQATMGSVRLKLLKVAAQVTVSVRRVYVQLSSAYPRQELFRLCQQRLMRLPLWSA
ncbi:MAG: IS1380 family transposase [Acidobacteriales bacterium]|nr:IS1380 family transposase [Terriglobales bacterium]